MCPDVTDAVPSILQTLSNDAYLLPPRTEVQQKAVVAAAESSVESSLRMSRTLRSYIASQRGTAAGLLSLNEDNCQRFFDFTPEAGMDDFAAQVLAVYGSAADQSTDDQEDDR